MNTNTDTFTDEQLLNLVNNSILSKTKFAITDFTGGYVSITLNTNKKQDTCKVALLFGYKNRNSQSVIFEVDGGLIFIWIKAIRLKIESLKVDGTGMDFNQLNGLMNTSYDVRTNDVRKRTVPIPITKEKENKEKEKSGVTKRKKTTTPKPISVKKTDDTIVVTYPRYYTRKSTP